jgi:phosphate uptake regulator
MIGADAIIKCLEAEGVSTVFGYPGVAICPFFNSILDSDIKTVLIRTEQNAAHAASGVARMTGRPGVCAVTSGPGATNVITGIATAFADSIPMICITGQVNSELLGSDVFQEADITGAVESFVKYSYLVKNVNDIPRVFREAFYIANTGRKGPVLIDIPIDIQNATIKNFHYPEEVNLRTYKPTVKGHAVQIKKVIKELERMASLAEENLNRAMNALITLDEEDIEEVYEVEKNINFLNHAITDYLVKINQTTLPIEDLNSLGALFHVVNDIERIGDHAENVADAARQRKEEGVSISKEAQKELGDMLEMVNKIIRYAVEMFAKSDETHMQEIITLEDQVDEKERELQKKHVERLTKGECSPEAGMIFSDIVSGLERVADHATNIAFAITTEEEMDEGKTN